MVILRIAIIEGDRLAPQANAKYGSYHNLIEKLLRLAAAKLSPSPTLLFSSYDTFCSGKLPGLDEVDAVLITGSKYSAFDDIPWIQQLISYTQLALTESRIRVLGICFGHQIVARALAGQNSVGRSKSGWELGVTDVNLSDQGKNLFRVSKLAVHEMHHDEVLITPKQVQILGSSVKCENEGMYENRNLLTVQGHPEYNEDIVSELLHIRYNKEIIDEQQFHDAIERAKKPHDGILIGETFLRFLLE